MICPPRNNLFLYFAIPHSLGSISSFNLTCSQMSCHLGFSGSMGLVAIATGRRRRRRRADGDCKGSQMGRSSLYVATFFHIFHLRFNQAHLQFYLSYRVYCEGKNRLKSWNYFYVCTLTYLAILAHAATIRSPPAATVSGIIVQSKREERRKHRSRGWVWHTGLHKNGKTLKGKEKEDTGEKCWELGLY
jgi:hypothetical protein